MGECSCGRPLALVAQSRAKDVGTDELVDKLVRKLRTKMVDRTMQTSPTCHNDLDGTALGKTSKLPFFDDKQAETSTVALDATRAAKQVEDLEEEIMTMRKDFRHALEFQKANSKKGRWKAIAAVLKKFRPILMALSVACKGDWELETMKKREPLVFGAAVGVAATAAALVAEARANIVAGGDAAGNLEAVAKKAEEIEGAATKIKDNLKEGLELRTARVFDTTSASARASTSVLGASLAALIGP